MSKWICRHRKEWPDAFMPHEACGENHPNSDMCIKDGKPCTVEEAKRQ